MSTALPNTLRSGPDGRGRFGEFGGRFVAETLMPLILELETAYEAAKADPSFQTELDYYLKHYVGRPSPLWFAERLTKELGGAKVYFKRDELNHPGSQKPKNCTAQTASARGWVANVSDTYFLIGTVGGPHPYPMMVRDFQSVIGEEAKLQMREAEGRLPDAAVACIGGGSNAMGLFHPFLDDPSVRLIGGEAGGHRIAPAPPPPRL